MYRETLARLLRLFDGGGAPTGDTGTPADAAQGADAQADAHDTDGTGGNETTISDEEAFERLIRGRYRDAFARRTHDLIEKRLRSRRDAEADLDALRPVTDALYETLGVEAGNTKALADAFTARMNENTSSPSGAQTAAEATQTAAETAEMPAENANECSLLGARATAERWAKESEALSREYPMFSLETELANEAFFTLVRSGLPLRDAYRTAHFDELMRTALEYASQRAAQRSAVRIAERASRPLENGARRGAGVRFKTDVAHMTSEQLEDIQRRVLRGERVRL